MLLLVGMEGMGYAEVAQVLDIPVGTAMWRLSRDSARLRELMEAPAATDHTAPPLRWLK